LELSDACAHLREEHHPPTRASRTLSAPPAAGGLDDSCRHSHASP
jgi:hypothetical protein